MRRPILRKRQALNPRQEEAAAPGGISEFRAAVADVTPAAPVPRVFHSASKPPPVPIQSILDDKQVLVDSLSDGDPWAAGFETGDELCFLRPGLPPTLLKKLRRGNWVIQDELDLHGLTRIEARIRLGEFLHE